MKKKVGALFCRIVGVEAGWLDVEFKTGGYATIFLKHNISDNLRTVMESYARNKTLLNIYCAKNKHGDFIFGSYKTFAGATRAQKSKRLRAQAEMENIIRDNYNPVHGKTKNKAAKHSLAPKKGTAKISKVARAVITGMVADETKPIKKKSIIDFMP